MYDSSVSPLSSSAAVASVPFTDSLDALSGSNSSSARLSGSSLGQEPSFEPELVARKQSVPSADDLCSLDSSPKKYQTAQNSEVDFNSVQKRQGDGKGNHDEVTGLNPEEPLLSARASKQSKKGSSDRFSPIYGYGLVNAAKAVAWAAGQHPLALKDVPDLGRNNWGNDMVKAPEAWASGVTGAGVTVAVIDSGVDIYHPDLAENIWYNSGEIAGDGIDNDRNGYADDVNGWNFALKNNDLRDRDAQGKYISNHGTHVAGTIAAVNNGFGATGVAYDAQIMPISLSNRKGELTGNVAKAIYYAVDNGARVINMSFEGSYNDPRVRKAIAYAAKQDVITVYSAGNGSLPSPEPYPANYATKYGIAVGAVNQMGVMPGFSNRAGFDPDLGYVVAPGEKVWSTIPISTGQAYGFKDGTSMAAPHVAGVAALMVEANPNITANQARLILAASATPISGKNQLAEFSSLNAVTPDPLIAPSQVESRISSLNRPQDEQEVVAIATPESSPADFSGDDSSYSLSDWWMEDEHSVESDRGLDGFYSVQDLLSYNRELPNQ